MILHSPSQEFFHKLSLMNLDIVILEYGHDAFLHGCLRNEKLHTPSIKVRQTGAKHKNIITYRCNNDPVTDSLAFAYFNPNRDYFLGREV